MLKSARFTTSTPQTIETFTVADLKANAPVSDARFARPRGQ